MFPQLFFNQYVAGKCGVQSPAEGLPYMAKLGINPLTFQPVGNVLFFVIIDVSDGSPFQIDALAYD